MYQLVVGTAAPQLRPAQAFVSKTPSILTNYKNLARRRRNQHYLSPYLLRPSTTLVELRGTSSTNPPSSSGAPLACLTVPMRLQRKIASRQMTQFQVEGA